MKKYDAKGSYPTGMALKILLIMKLSTLLLLVGFLQVSATTYGQRIYLTKESAPIKTVLQAIAKQTGHQLIYTESQLEKVGAISVDLQGQSLQEALQTVFMNQPVTYRIRNNTIIIQDRPIDHIRSERASADAVSPMAVQPMVIKGTVTDQSGQPLESVNIRNKGTGITEQTNRAGQFEIRATQGDILIVSYVGYQTKEVLIEKEQSIQITMTTEIEELEKITIVSTGYQTISKERSAGAFAKPDMETIALRSTSMNVLQRLDGLVPGLTVNNAPQSENPLLIRGLSTIGIDGGIVHSGTNRNPLYVVDGIPLEDVSSINPQDVADITVLKDATAASIWGARASNGVIVITTKKGNLNDRIKVTYDGFINFLGKPDLDYTPVLTSEQFIETAKEIFDPVSYPWASVSAYSSPSSTGLAPHEVILYNQYRGIITEEQANRSLDSLASINNHQQIRDLFYRNASIMNHSLSLSGGSQKYAFYGSMAYTNMTSPRPGEKNNSYKINLRQDLNFNDRLQLYLITDLTNHLTSANRQPAIDYRFYPYQLFQGDNGEHLSVPYMGILSESVRADMENRSKIGLDYVPLDEVNYGYTNSDAWTNRITGGLKLNLLEGLRFEGVYGYVRGTNKTTRYDDAQSYTVRSELVQFTVAPTPLSTPQYYLPTTGGNYSVDHFTQRNWTVRNQLVYDNNWNNNQHQLTLLGGQEAQDQLTVVDATNVKGYDESLQTYALLDYQSLNTTGVASPVMDNSYGRSVLYSRPFSKTESQIRFTSYYGNAAYTYERKYSINGSWRVDHSNLFGIDKSAQNKPVWSAGIKWIVGDENFLQSTEWLDHLALRVTYGITGNSPMPGTASSYDILNPVTNGALPDGKGFVIATAANPQLTWESTAIWNVGLDFSIVHNRLNGSLDLYDKKTDNLIGGMDVNSFTGYRSVIGNYGSLQNKGFELNVNSLNIAKGDFQWRTNLSLAYNKNTITQLNTPVTMTTGDEKVFTQYLTDYPAFAIFAFRYAGLDNLGDPQIYRQDNTITKEPYVSTPDDVIFMGTYQPVWSGGLSNSFRYGAFGLTVNTAFNLGHVMRVDVGPNYTGIEFTGRLTAHANILSRSDQSGFTGGQLHPNFLNRWKKPGDEAFTNVPSFVSNIATSYTRRSGMYYRFADINVTSASFIKLRDITLTYDLPKDILRYIHTENVSLRLQVSNIMLWKANKYNIDPEFHDPRYGSRVPYSPSVAGTAPDLNTQSYRFGQGTITVGARVNF